MPLSSERFSIEVRGEHTFITSTDLDVMGEGVGVHNRFMNSVVLQWLEDLPEDARIEALHAIEIRFGDGYRWKTQRRRVL